MNTVRTTSGSASFLEGSPFVQPRELKQSRLLAELSDLTRLHREGSASYDRMITAVFGGSGRFDSLEALPWLPVQLFKRLDLKSVPDEQIVRTLVSSGTTGSAPSRVFLDKDTARAQTTALARIVGHFIGPQRLPMVIVDDNSLVTNRLQFNARGAATLGFSNMGRDHFYALDGKLEPKWSELEEYLRKHAEQPIMLFGFTFLVWQFVQKANAAGVALRFPAGSLLIHGGGWKKLQDRKVDNDTFKAALRATFGLERVHNYYGMVEQVGSIFFECESGWLHTPAYADVIVRDRMTLEPLPPGEEGLIQVLSILPRSYPGHSLLTEDLGTVAGEDDCACGRMGKRFSVAGRLPQAELRGCSDTRALPTTGAQRMESREAPNGATRDIMIDTVFSTNPSPSWPQEVQRLAQLPRRDPFAADAIALVGTLSQRILRSALARQVPELAALAHWFRPANLRTMATRFAGDGRATRVRPRGVVFALSPANVEVLFIYAWLLSLLAGNATIVRVSRKPSPVRDSFVALIRALAQEPEHAAVLRDSWIVTYEHDAALSKTLSEACHARLVWGGDATVAAIRSIPLNPLAVEISFADRFSLAALDAASVLAQTDDALREVARRFVNDTLWSDQQACSSPRAVIWIGAPEDVVRAKTRFWEAYRKAAEGFADNPSSVMARATDLFALAAAGGVDGLGASPAQRPALGNGTSRLESVREIHSGHGLFVEYVATQAADIAGFVREKDQTLVVYGLPDEALGELIESLPNRALDRIVAPGQATEFSTLWDGTDLFDVLTRKIGLSA